MIQSPKFPSGIAMLSSQHADHMILPRQGSGKNVDSMSIIQCKQNRLSHYKLGGGFLTCIDTRLFSEDIPSISDVIFMDFLIHNVLLMDK